MTDRRAALPKFASSFPAAIPMVVAISMLAGCQTTADSASAGSEQVSEAVINAATIHQVANRNSQLIDRDRFPITENDADREIREARQALVAGYLGGKMAGSRSDMAAAADQYRAALAISPNDPELLSRSLVYEVAAGEMELAADMAESLLQLDPGHGLALLTRLVHDAKQGRFHGAADKLAALRVTGNKLVPVNNGQGLRNGYHITVGIVDDSLGLALDAWLRYGVDSSWRPEKPLANHFDNHPEKQLIERLRVKGQAALHDWAFARLDVDGLEALTELDDAILRAPSHNNMRVMREVMAHLAADGYQEEIDRRMEIWRKRAPDNGLLRRLQVSFENGKYDQPLMDGPQGGITAALLESGFLLNAMQLRLASVAMIQLALHLEPENRFGQMMLSENLQNLDQDARAAEILASIPVTDIDAREAREDLAYILSRLDRRDEAIAVLEEMAAQDSKDLVMASVLTRFLASAERYEDAANVMSKAIDTLDKPEKRHWTLFYERAKAYERNKEWAKAEPDFLKALELYPDQPYVLNYLGYSWVDQGLYLDRALGMIDKAVRAKPNEGFIVDSLGWAYYKLERYEEAEKYLQRAVLLSPSDPLLLDHYGDALWQNGRHREARFQWERAITFGAEDEVLAAVQDKLENGLTQ